MQHLTLGEEIVFDKVMSLRNDLKAEAGRMKKRSGSKDNSAALNKLSFMPILVKATSLALSQYPQLNASLNSDATELTYHGNHNIGVAMDTPKGLIVPVLREVQNKTIFQIAVELFELQVN